jgi:hypothetical protein
MVLASSVMSPPVTVMAMVEVLLMMELDVIASDPELRVKAPVAVMELVVIVIAPVTVIELALVMELPVMVRNPLAWIAAELPVMLLLEIVMLKAETDVAVLIWLPLVMLRLPPPMTLTVVVVPSMVLPFIDMSPLTVAAMVEEAFVIELDVIVSAPEPNVKTPVHVIVLLVIVIAPVTLTLRALVIEAVVIESIPPAVIAAELPVMILFAIVISNAETDVAV